MALNRARRIFAPTDPDLADILGRTDLNFEKFVFFISWTPTFWISRSPDFQDLAWAGLRLGLGRAWAYPWHYSDLVYCCLDDPTLHVI